MRAIWIGPVPCHWGWVCEQRRALRAMYRTCAFGNCDVHVGQCEIHHALPFELGGRTDLDNLSPLCARHRHVVHELGWKLDLAPDRHLTIRQPDGTVYSVESMQSDRPLEQLATLTTLTTRANARENGCWPSKGADQRGRGLRFFSEIARFFVAANEQIGQEAKSWRWAGQYSRPK